MKDNISAIVTEFAEDAPQKMRVFAVGRTGIKKMTLAEMTKLVAPDRGDAL